MITFHICQKIVESQLMLCTCLLFYGIVLAQDQTKRAVGKGALARWQAVSPPLWTRLLIEPHCRRHSAANRHGTHCHQATHHQSHTTEPTFASSAVEAGLRPSPPPPRRRSPAIWHRTPAPPTPWPLTPDSRSRTSTMQDAAFDGAALVPHC